MNKTFHSILSIAVIVSLAIATVSCGGKKSEQQTADGELSGNISISGAFALYPLAVKWAEEFQKLHPEVKIEVDGGGQARA